MNKYIISIFNVKKTLKLKVKNGAFLQVLIVFLTLFVVYACKKPKSYSDIPQISYLETIIKDTTDALGNKTKKAILLFYLVDGDGNIGLSESDTFPPWDASSKYHHNLFINVFSWNGTDFLPATDYDSLNFRIPYVEPQGQNKVLKCTISIDIDFKYTLQNPIPFDTVRFDFYIYDRALNISNKESSGLVKLQ